MQGNDSDNKLKINISYKQSFIKNKQTREIINAFGLADVKQNVIVKDFEFNLEPKMIYYIYGYSGSGKSSILNFIHNTIKTNYDIIYIKKWDQLKIENKALIEFFENETTEYRLYILSKCGLGEAWKFISRYNDLSDGEKFRFILYKSIMELKDVKNPVLIFDEFCATLDRTTSKAISNNISKLRDKFGITFILASTHDDLVKYLGADFNIFKEYHEQVEISKTI